MLVKFKWWDYSELIKYTKRYEESYYLQMLEFNHKLGCHICRKTITIIMNTADYAKFEPINLMQDEIVEWIIKNLTCFGKINMKNGIESFR